MATRVSRRDPCGCRAELAVLLNRFEALTASVADLSLQVRGWRADQARRRAVGEQDDRDAVLGALVAELVGDAAFSAADVIVMARATKGSELRYALASAGAVTGRKLGHLLSRLEARRDRSDGIHFIRIGADREGVVWRVLRD
jgi:hypothetical protein